VRLLRFLENDKTDLRQENTCSLQPALKSTVPGLLLLFFTLRPSSLPVVVAQPDERHANKAAYVLKWYDIHRA